MIHTSINTTSAGLVKDTSPLTQKEGTYTYALNGILESTRGDYPFLSNELGNTLSWTFIGENDILIGKVLTDTETFICCVVNDDTSIIGEYFPQTDSFTTIVDDPNLNFDSRYPIKMLFRVRKGCERTIYFTDNYNPYRVMDIDNLAQYGTPFDAARLNLFRNLEMPNFYINGVQDYGGDTKLGTYQFAVQYLDKDLNETPWIDFTPFVPIVDEPLSSEYFKVDGGYNIVDFTVDTIGGVPNSTKTIELQIDNLDQDFAFFRIAVIMSTAGVGEVSEVYLMEPQPITSDSATWLFRGATINNSTPTTLAEVQAGVLEIDRVGSHAQIDNKLILGDLSNKQIDWASIQQAANLIGIEWTGKEIEKQDMENTGAAKSPDYYLHSKSFLRDEVYAIGVYGIRTNGKLTPVFHVPGRELIAGEDDELIVDTDIPLEDVRHLGFDDPLDDIGYGPGIVLRWLVYNTADASGLMGFWEADVAYPEDVDCTDTRIYPEGNIRHHKFPDTRIAPIEEDTVLFKDYIKVIGIKPDMTNFLAAVPSEIAVDILEWRLCFAKRTETERTILDKGYIATGVIAETDNADDSFFEDDVYHDFLFRYPVGWGDPIFDKTKHFYMSPKQMFERPQYNGDFITVENQLDVAFNQTALFIDRLYIQWTSDIVNTDLYHRALDGYRHIDRYKQLDGVELPGSLNAQFPAVRADLNATPVVNVSFTTPTLVLSTMDDYDWEQANVSDSPKLSYVSVKKNNKAVNVNLSNLEYITLQKETVPFDHYFGGDIFITRLDHKVSSIGNTWVMISAYYESEINSELRHEGLVDPIVQSYFKADPYIDNLATEVAIAAYVQGYYEPEDKYYGRPEFLAYNADYGKQNDTRPLLPLPFNYNWCSDCGDKYPYRIIASETSFQSEITDRYRTFLANNFTDLNGDCGGIEELFTANDNLYCLTYNYPVFIPTKPQSLQTNENLTYVGTGEIFSIQPRKMSTTPYPYGGCRDWMGVITTEFGTFYPDSEHGKIHLLGNPPTEIGNGITNWLEENLPFEIDKQFYNLLGYKYPWRYPTNGIGIVATYDPRHKRILITKNDYTIYNEDAFGGELDFTVIAPLTNTLYFDPATGVFFVSNDGAVNTAVPFSNILYFVNHSWTLSYSPKHQAWASFHSYLPYNYLNDGNDFYSCKQGNGQIHRHNQGNYTTYYNDTKKKFVVEFIANKDPQLVKTFGSMEIVAESTLDGIDKDTIFDRAWFYNSYQSTGFKNIMLKTSTFQTDTSTTGFLIDRVQRNWKFNNIRDQVLTPDLALYTSEWPSIRSDYFTDQVPVNTTTNPSQFQLARMRDRWLACRFEFKPAQNNKLIVNILNTQQNISYR